MKRCILAFVTLVTAACGGSSSGGSNATVTIVTPTANSTVTRDGQGNLPVTFALTNFTLRDPGQCGSLANCGHIHLRIDGTGSTCNSPFTEGGGYNNQISSGTTAQARFNFCTAPATPTGTHTITLQLHDDMHNPVVDSSGQQIQAQVAVTVQ